MRSSKLLLLLLAYSAFVRAAGPDSTSSPDERYVDAINHCLKKTFKQMQCNHLVDGNTLDLDGRLGQLGYRLQYNIYHQERAILRQGKSFLRAVVTSSEDASYWQEASNSGSYAVLKKFAIQKAKKENLQSCQRACLATCISSRLLKYNNENRPHHLLDGLGRLEGNCREFSSMANDLMRAMKVDSSVVVGRNYKIKDGERPEDSGAHAMIGLSLKGEEYIMEPQNSGCVFYDTSFSHQRRKFQTRIMN